MYTKADLRITTFNRNGGVSMVDEKTPLYKIDGSKFIALYFSGHKLACPHCGGEIEMEMQLGTVEFKKPKETVKTT